MYTSVYACQDALMHFCIPSTIINTDVKRNTGYSSTMRSVVLIGVNELGAQSRVSVYIIYGSCHFPQLLNFCGVCFLQVFCLFFSRFHRFGYFKGSDLALLVAYTADADLCIRKRAGHEAGYEN